MSANEPRRIMLTVIDHATGRKTDFRIPDHWLQTRPAYCLDGVWTPAEQWMGIHDWIDLIDHIKAFVPSSQEQEEVVA